MNKKILFGLAAAAAIVLAVITYNSNPPATDGTEATIGAAQRAQAPQIAAQDVKLGDTSAQDVLQTETFDAIMKDETLRTMLQDAEFRKQLQDAELRSALQDDAIRKALNDPGLAQIARRSRTFASALNNPELAKKFDDANLRLLLSNQRVCRCAAQPAVPRPADAQWRRGGAGRRGDAERPARQGLRRGDAAATQFAASAGAPALASNRSSSRRGGTPSLGVPPLIFA